MYAASASSCSGDAARALPPDSHAETSPAPIGNFPARTSIAVGVPGSLITRHVPHERSASSTCGVAAPATAPPVCSTSVSNRAGSALSEPRALARPIALAPIDPNAADPTSTVVVRVKCVTRPPGTFDSRPTVIIPHSTHAAAVAAINSATCTRCRGRTPGTRMPASRKSLPHSGQVNVVNPSTGYRHSPQHGCRTRSRQRTIAATIDTPIAPRITTSISSPIPIAGPPIPPVLRRWSPQQPVFPRRSPALSPAARLDQRPGGDSNARPAA